jgi:branched-chain amino acid transport system ATP-binding protein
VTAPLLEVDRLAKRFGGLMVLRDVSFRVMAGEIAALIGPNGAGKTTLFNLVSGLDRPSAGRIRLGDIDVTGRAAFRISRMGVGRTFQTPRPLLELTARDNVRAAAFFAARPAATPDELLDLLGLPPAAPAASLTLARRKLLELAMALALGPRVLLLDEILAGLTGAEVHAATSVMRQIRDRWGVSLLWTEHVMQAVMSTAERVLVLHHGELLADGDPTSVVADDRVRAAYLGEHVGA